MFNRIRKDRRTLVDVLLKNMEIPVSGVPDPWERLRAQKWEDPREFGVRCD